MGSSKIIISVSMASIDAIVNFLKSSGDKLIGFSFSCKSNLSLSDKTILSIYSFLNLSCFGPKANSSLTEVERI